MKNSMAMALAVAMSQMPADAVFEIRPREGWNTPELGYWPTANKHIAKRQKRKAKRRREAANLPVDAKPYRERNKKGRP